MHKRKLPKHDQLWSPSMTRASVRDIVESMWRANADTDTDSSWGKHLFFAPNEGLFLYDDRWVHPSVVEILLRKHVNHIGFLFHQGEIMVAYEFYAKNEARLKLSTIDRYMMQSDDE